MSTASEQQLTPEAAFDRLLERLPALREGARAARETLLANLVMAGEIPAPTFGEQRRGQFLQDRFCELGLQNCSMDEVENSFGILPGAGGADTDAGPNILVPAHLDTIFAETDDHTITVSEDRVTGAGVGDNSLGVAMLATLPTLLERLGVTLQSNLILMGASRSLGRGDLMGLRFFLSNSELPIRAGVCLEGVQLGRLSYNSIGMLRGEINVEVPEQYDWTRFGASGAVQIINEAINRIQDIPLPSQPRSSIVLGAVQAGTSFHKVPTRATLRFEIRSESADIVARVRETIAETAEELAARTQADVSMDVVSQREPGGIAFGHPLVKHSRRIMEALDIEPRIAPSMSELASFIHRQVPAITLGLTLGANLEQKNETVFIEPMITGMAQLVAVLLAIDEGLCDEDRAVAQG